MNPSAGTTLPELEALPKPEGRQSTGHLPPPAGHCPGSGCALTDLRLADSYGALGEAFFSRVTPSALADPYLVAASGPACALVGVEPASLSAPEAVAALAGNALLPGSRPLAAVYAGHQFGIWAGRLGDGRALLLGDTSGRGRSGYTALGGQDSKALGGQGPAAGGPDQSLLDCDRWELQLKGSGVTPYSRMADGRAVLRSSIREFLCSEAMAALGIPTTRAMAVVGSDVPVFREDVETAAVVLRMSPSFVRFGTFEYFYQYDKHDALKVLADHVIEQFYPECARRQERYAAFLSEVTARTARLMAKWQAVGFCHGVMNTDNMSILGLTIDYGPFGFLDAFEADHICNHSDEGGRYAYSNQPDIGEWNCFALGQSLVPLIGSPEAAVQALQVYKGAYQAEFMRQMRAKLGLLDPRPDDTVLFEQLFAMLERNRADFTLFFRNLGAIIRKDPTADAPVRDLCLDRADCDRWLARYRTRLEVQGLPDEQRRQAMNRVNPRFVLRNYLAEDAIRQSNQALGDPPQARDFSAVRRLAEVLSRPFDEQPESDRYAALPPEWAAGIEVSCSS